MGSVLKPYARSAPGILQAPTGQSTIDWTHPLVRGLLGYWLPGVMRGIDLSAQTPTLWASGSATTLVNPADALSAAGPGANAPQNTTQGLAAVAPPIYKTTTAFSIAWRGFWNPTTGNSNFPSFCGVFYNDPASAPFNVWSMGLDNNVSLVINWNNAGTQANFAIALSNFSAGVQTLVATFTVGGTVFMYANGIQISSQAFGASAPNTTATSNIQIGGGVNGVCNMVAMWNRALTQQEALFLTLDPYGMVLPAEADIPILRPPALVTTFRRTLSRVGTRTGSRQPHGWGGWVT